MPEILLYDENITVLGSPETVIVQTDFGPQGTRGSQIFVSNGNPNIVGIGQNPNLNDLCINIASGSEYTDLYQYVSVPGGNTWTKLFRIQDPGTGIYQDEYVSATDVAFTSGLATMTIPLSLIAETLPSGLTKDNFAIQISVESSSQIDEPILCGFYIQPLSNPATNLSIDLNAKQFSMGYTNPLNGTYKVHITVWIVGV